MRKTRILSWSLLPISLLLVSCEQDTPTTISTTSVSNPVFSIAGGGVEEIEIQDKCEPDSFNAAIGAGTCVGDEDVTFAEFLEELNPDDGGHGAWSFDPDDTHIDAGEVVLAINEGGETHTFTEVDAFGGGFVDELNVALPPGTPPAVVLESFFATFVAPGDTRTLAGLSVGTHRFQCGIHPWMRTVVEVRED